MPRIIRRSIEKITVITWTVSWDESERPPLVEDPILALPAPPEAHAGPPAADGQAQPASSTTSETLETDLKGDTDVTD
jgi:hypothetical protein